ncbi:MAG: ABC transporter ATP-binding protein [Acidobacteria bacterium]|nr:MAG: ABC transporter ATP-binding protein [Acidobacteriota bacterium]
MPAETKAIVIAVDRLSKTYPVSFLRLKKLLRRKFKPPVEALREISFAIKEGEIFGLIGPNGAGKTTLTKIIATLVQPTSGNVIVKGHDSVADDQNVRRNVGLSGAEERSFYWRLTAEQNLLFFARLHGLNGRVARNRIAELFALLELQELATRRFAELSTGNKQRLSVARALLAKPAVLLLDEPTRSLDPIAAARMRSIIKSLAQTNNATIFLTSHNLTEVEELCDRVAIIGKGEIRALDTPQNLRTTHTEEERLTIAFSGLSVIDAEQALARSFKPELFVFEPSCPDESLVKFTRAADDDLLDRVLRVLQQSGATIRSVESERATLLDVLESYEKQSGELPSLS